MDPRAKKMQFVERELYESLGRTGGIIPKTVEQVEAAERNANSSGVQLPERLRSAEQVFRRISKSPGNSANQNIPLVFGHFVSMLRKKHGYSVEALADKAKVDVSEICQIEVDAEYEPKPRTVAQLASTLGVATKAFVRLAKLRSTGDKRLAEGAVQFAACANRIETLTKEQRRALNDFVKLLNSAD